MSDNVGLQIVPKEAAKEVAQLARELGGFLSKVFGTLPQDTVGVLGGDWLHHVRVRNAHRLQQRTEAILQGRKAEQRTEPLSPSVAIPLLRAAQDESRDEIQELWARLLSNAMDRDFPPIRRVFINILQQLEVLEARILRRLSDWDGTDEKVCFLDTKLGINWSKEFGATDDQFEISIQNLIKLECISVVTSYHSGGAASNSTNGHFNPSMLKVDDRAEGYIKMTTLGRELLRALQLAEVSISKPKRKRRGSTPERPRRAEDRI
jgi:hypothetical protein